MGYSFYRTITIDHTKVPNTDQTDFPVLVSGTYTYLKTVGNGGKVTDANGYDIVFATDNAGTSLLNFEIETYSATTGVVNFWVKIPSVSHTVDTVFYMVYTNAAVTTFQGNVNGTWNTGFLGVWHFGNGSSLSVADSTSNGYTLTINGSITAGAAQVDGGAVFDGATGWARNTSFAWTITPGQTVSCWINISSYAGNPIIVRFISSSNAYILINSSGHLQSCESSICTACVSNDTLSTGAWQHIAFVYTDVAARKMYLNGAECTYSAVGSFGAIGTNSDLAVGGNFGASLLLPGTMDELKISNAVRSGDWITSEYNNQFSPSTFYTVGSETPVPGTGGAFGKLSSIIGLIYKRGN